MERSNPTQKKKIVLNYIYATVIGLLIIACAVVIAVVNANSTTSTQGVVTPNENVQVSVTTFVVPVKNATVAKDYSGSELQYNDTLKQWEIHKAIDFVANEDKNVYAATDGTVSNVYTNYLEGTVIEISHADGLVSVYKSLSDAVNVSVGDKVSAGSIIGQVSESMAQELNTGAHLHFEMTKNGAKVNPNDYIDLGNK
ncbi:MAG: M23 family metallopeptidase [Clostridiales bacterium]|nr:M23 family metallopeptidase [Clostridiales bacterium]